MPGVTDKVGVKFPDTDAQGSGNIDQVIIGYRYPSCFDFRDLAAGGMFHPENLQSDGEVIL